MDIERIEALVKLMVDNELTEMDIRSENEQIALKRGGPAAPVLAAPIPLAVAAPVAAAAAPAPASPAATPPPPADDLVPIPSPMVGTFYAAPSPDSPPYVTIGSEIDTETVVCIVEAMKVMNEIKAEVRGSVAKVLVNNGQAVEYGQPLFMVRKS